MPRANWSKLIWRTRHREPWSDTQLQHRVMRTYSMMLLSEFGGVGTSFSGESGEQTRRQRGVHTGGEFEGSNQALPARAT